jgi:hypothetical protein
LKTGQLEQHPTDAAEVRRLLAAAERNLADARVTAISPETRLDAAYETVMQAALAALMAHGYRPDTNRPGYTVAVKVIDIFGNDTMTLVPVNVG